MHPVERADRRAVNIFEVLRSARVDDKRWNMTGVREHEQVRARIVLPIPDGRGRAFPQVTEKRVQTFKGSPRRATVARERTQCRSNLPHDRGRKDSMTRDVADHDAVTS